MTKIKEELDGSEFYKNSIESFISSKGTRKMWNYFLDVIKKDYFIETIKELRLKYNIPENGFVSDGANEYIPPHGFKKEDKLREDIIRKICKKYKLHAFDFSEVILNFVYYNKASPLYEVGACGLLRVSDVIEEKEDPFDDFIQESDDLAYPISIRISPYASQRDIIDFIKNKVVWKNQIEFLQKKYTDRKIKIGKVKSKNKAIQERNNFIFNNRDKSLKEIRKLLSIQKIFLDDGHIAKIISLEKQKRKEV